MRGKMLIVGGLIAALAMAPVSHAWAQYARPYYYYSNPLLWPFQAAAAVVVGAATIATLPFRVIAGATYPGPAYYAPPAYYPPAYAQPVYVPPVYWPGYEADIAVRLNRYFDPRDSEIRGYTLPR